MASRNTVHPELAAILCIDVQDKILNLVCDHESVRSQAENLIKVAALRGLPVMKIEHCPDRLGPTNAGVAAAMGDVPVYAKTTFSSFRDQAIEEAVASLGRSQLIMFGVECHICVCQTALDALEKGYSVFVVADASSSIKPFDRLISLERMRQAGACITTAQATAFELVERADEPLFKTALPMLRVM